MNNIQYSTKSLKDREGEFYSLSENEMVHTQRLILIKKPKNKQLKIEF